MKEGFRQAMAWLHTWTGLIFGWLLFAISLSRTLAAVSRRQPAGGPGLSPATRPKRIALADRTAEHLRSRPVATLATSPGRTWQTRPVQPNSPRSANLRLSVGKS